jgi:WD40-like Beta Propeller Repeat
MRATPFRILVGFAVLITAGSLVARENVRSELSRLQKQTGLTLAWYYTRVQTLRFADRSTSEDGRTPVAGNLENALLSPDGSEVAFPTPGPEHPHRPHLTIATREGTVINEYPALVNALALCWSHDKTKLVVRAETAPTRPPQDSLFILDLSSRAIRRFGDEHSYATAQCWSPDDKQIVFSSNDETRIYSLSGTGWRDVVQGHDATWSPDGLWIGFHRQDGYYAIPPAGGEPKPLFKTKQGRSELFWSPDSRSVAYLGEGGTFLETLKYIDVGLIQIRVRRLSDGAEDWVWQTPDVPPAWFLKPVWVDVAKYEDPPQSRR